MDTASITFRKMHGLGNDFVVIDARVRPVTLDASQVRAIAHRQKGVGCDQVIVLETSRKADCFMRIFNADGGQVEACGNASRCVGAILFEEGKQTATIETLAGMLAVRREGGLIAVDMGRPRLEWKEIPLSEKQDTLHLDLSEGILTDPVAVSMGNPHAVFFVKDALAVPLDELGPKLERHKLFPERANISAAQVASREHIILRVWERGAGLTLACGTAACAVAVAASRRGLTERMVRITLPGGDLQIAWAEDDHVWMTGPAATSFRGEIDPALLAPEQEFGGYAGPEPTRYGDWEIKGRVSDF